MSDNSEKVRIWTERLVIHLLAARDKRIRTTILAENLSRLRSRNVVMVMDEICRRAEHKIPHYQEALFSLIDIPAITGVLGHPKMSEIYLLSKEMGCSRVVTLLSNPPTRKKPFSEYDFVEGEVTDRITLGEKRSLAKGVSKDTLDRLVYDSDPHVIRNLLNNPKMTERDVLKAASKRPTSSEVLKEVFHNGKWSSRYSIKKALVKNPFTPTGIALGLLSFLLEQDLREIGKDRTVHPEIKNAAEELLKKEKD